MTCKRCDEAKQLLLQGIATKERLILVLLEEGPLYGLDMVEQSGGMLRRGTIYVVLAGMEDAGLVDRVPGETLSSGVSRSRYKLTDAGVAVAQAIQREQAHRTTQNEDTKTSQRYVVKGVIGVESWNAVCAPLREWS